MDTIGLLAAWTGVLSILCSLLIAAALYLATPLFQKWRAARNPDRASSIDSLTASDSPDLSYIARLISLYGALILNLVAGTGLAIVSIEILDLGPALLAAVLPFNINARTLTRVTGLALLAGSYIFVFRLSYLVVKLRLLTLRGGAEPTRRALREIPQLLNRKSAAASGLTQAGVK